MEIKAKEYISAPENIHTPSSIINIFNNAISVEEDKKVIIMHGIYESKGFKNYHGYYYDQLKDEIGNQSLTIVVPELLRKELKDGYTFKLKGYLNRKVIDDGSIKLNFVVIDILLREGKRMTSDDLKAFDIRKKKADMGYRNLEEVIKGKLYKKQSVKIALIYGNEAVIDHDIYNALGQTVYCYNIKEHRVSLASKDSIIKKINEVNNEDYDVIVIARGGGSGQEIFNNIEIAEMALSSKPIFVTAIGHAYDKSLLQDIADKEFDTPSALGGHLKKIADGVNSDLTKRKEEEEHIRKIEVDLKDELESQGLEFKNKIVELENIHKHQLDKYRNYGIILLIIGILIGAIIK